jgi:osmotically inducible protein OsmC
MARRIAYAEWSGEMGKGTGEVSIGGEHLGLAYRPAWLQEGTGTNAEELLAAAHAASFALALEAAFSRARHRTVAIRVRAELHLDRREGRWTITRSDLESEIALEEEPRTRDILQSEFQHIVEDAATNCTVSRALADVEVTVDAQRAGLGDGACPSSAEPRPSDPQRRSDGRERRVLEGEIVGRIRTQARRRYAPSAKRTSNRPDTTVSSPR